MRRGPGDPKRYIRPRQQTEHRTPRRGLRWWYIVAGVLLLAVIFAIIAVLGRAG